MIITAINPIPYARINERYIKINGYSIMNATTNICEPGWDICFQIAVDRENTAYYRFLIDDILYEYTWHPDSNHHAIYIIHPQPHDQQIIDDFRKLISGATA